MLAGLCSQAAELLVAVVDMEIGCCGRRRNLEVVPALLPGALSSS
jgi:hypothetical protein